MPSGGSTSSGPLSERAIDLGGTARPQQPGRAIACEQRDSQHHPDNRTLLLAKQVPTWNEQIGKRIDWQMLAKGQEQSDQCAPTPEALHLLHSRRQGDVLGSTVNQSCNGQPYRQDAKIQRCKWSTYRWKDNLEQVIRQKTSSGLLVADACTDRQTHEFEGRQELDQRRTHTGQTDDCEQTDARPP